MGLTNCAIAELHKLSTTVLMIVQTYGALSLW